MTEIDECRSEYQELWVSLVYIYKIVLMVAGLYFTWQTRHVTLPSLRDTKQTYFVVFTTISCALITLPSLLVADVGMHIRFASGGLAVWIVLTTTLTLLFLPKVSSTLCLHVHAIIVFRRQYCLYAHRPT